MSDTTDLSLTEKIKLYLSARGTTVKEYRVCEAGKCWKDTSGRFTIKSRLYFNRDGKDLFRGFKPKFSDEAYSEEDAVKNLLFDRFKAAKIHLCNRCGGAGGAVQWPGFTCFRCDGRCIDPDFDFEKEIERALKGEDFEGDYLAKVAAKEAKQKADQVAALLAQKEANRKCINGFREQNAELFARAKNALSIIGITSNGQWAIDLRFFLRHESEVDSIPGNVEGVKQICKIIESREAERQRLASVSEHVGTRGERQDFTARVVFSKTFPATDERPFEKTLTVLHDPDGNVLKYWNAVRVQDGDEKRPAVRDERVTFAAMVVEHGEYQGVKETVLQRVTKAKLA